MIKPIKSLELRWRSTENLDATFWNRFIKKLWNWNSTIERSVSGASRNAGFLQRAKTHVSYRADVLCYDSVIVELKALGKLGDVETAQILNYLKAGSAKGVSSSTSEQEACNMSDSSGRMNHGRRYDPKKEICVICVICGF